MQVGYDMTKNTADRLFEKTGGLHVCVELCVCMCVCLCVCERERECE